MKKNDVYQDIRYRIMSGEYILNHAIPAERDLTSIFHVSRVTVRSAIKALVEEGVLERSGRRGTIVRAVPYPEREKENNRSKTILYVYFSSIAGIRIEQDAETGVIYRGVEAYANRAGYSLMVQSEENYSLHGVPNFVDGVIVGGKDLLGHVLEIRRRGIPVVALSLTPKVDADMVCWDDFGAGQSAALRIAELGHREVCLTALQYQGEDYLQPSFRRRIAGFLDIAHEEGLTVHRWIIHESEHRDDSELRRRLRRLKQETGVTAFVDCSGQDPDIFDGIPAVSIGAIQMRPHPTTDFFFCDHERLGYLAAERLAAVMNNATTDRLRLLIPIKTRLVLKKLKPGM